MFKNGETKTAAFGPFVYVVICKKVGLLKEAPGKRCHTILSKLQQKEVLVVKRYKDAKNNIFSSNSVKRCLFMKGK